MRDTIEKYYRQQYSSLSEEDIEDQNCIHTPDEMIEFALSVVKNYSIPDVRHSTSRKGTVWYMIFVTTLCGLLAGLGWYHLGIEVGIFTLILLVVMFLASIRYNQ